MPRIPALPVAVAVAITAPVAALATVAVQRMSHRRPRPSLVADYGIRNVPARPPLWRTSAASPAPATSALSASPVPPENPHAPATPPRGIRQVR